MVNANKRHRNIRRSARLDEKSCGMEAMMTDAKTVAEQEGHIEYLETSLENATFSYKELEAELEVMRSITPTSGRTGNLV